MKTATKIKGIMAMAEMTLAETAALCGISRQTLHTYINSDVDIEDYDGGVDTIDTMSRVMLLIGEGKLPLHKSTPKNERLDKIREMLVEV